MNNFNPLKSRDIKCFLYGRKSTDTEDKQVLSLDNQVSEMKSLALKLGINIVDVILESKSAKEPEARPAFNAMLKRIEKGEANGIICWKINRLARNFVDGGKIIHMLQSGKIAYIQTHSGVYKPADNIMMMAVELGMSNQYVKDLSTDVKRSQRYKASLGWFPASVLPPGYAHRGKGKLGDQIVRSDSFGIVKVLWKKMISGQYSVPDIKREGDALGLKNKSGQIYSRASYYNIFTNPFYYGHFEWNDEEGNKGQFIGKHEVMVSEYEFNTVQRLLGRRGKPTKINTYTFPFRGNIHCGECGCSITAERKVHARCPKCKEKFSMRISTACPRCGTDASDMKGLKVVDKTYYRCTQKRGACAQPYMESAELEAQILAEVQKIHIEKDFYEWAIEGIKYLHRNEIDDQEHIVQQNRKRETELMKKLDNLVMMRASGEISSEQLLATRGVVEKELNDVRYTSQQVHERAIDWAGIANGYLDFATHAKEKLTSNDPQAKKEVLEGLGSNLTLKDKKLSICLPAALLGIKNVSNVAESLNARLEPQRIGSIQACESSLDAHSFTLLPDLDSNQDKRLQRALSYH